MPPETPRGRDRARDRTVFVVFGLLLVSYVAILAAVGRFPFFDEIFYKSAGREWAQRGRFAAPELWGFYDLVPPIQDVFFAYPPLYPFLYGLYVRVVGFGETSCIVFDASIHAALAAATCATARAVAPEISARRAVLAGLAVLPLGLLGRPDELAMTFGMLGLRHLHAMPLDARRAATAGVFFGFMGATSSATAFQLGLVALPHVLFAPGERVKRTLAWIASGALGLALLVAPLLLSRPDAFRQSFQIAPSQVVGPSLGALGEAWTLGSAFVCCSLGVVVCAGIACERSARFVRLWGGAIVAVLDVAILVPQKHPYMWFCGPWAVAAFAGEAGRVAGSRRWPGLLLLGALYVGAASRQAEDFLVHLTLPREQRFEAAAERVRALVPPGSRVVTREHWTALAWDRSVFDSFFAKPDLATIDYIVLTSNGARAHSLAVTMLMGDERKRFVRDHFEVVFDGLNREPNRLFGVPLGDRAWGYGAVVLKRVR